MVVSHGVHSCFIVIDGRGRIAHSFPFATCTHHFFLLPIGGWACHNFSYPQWMGTPRSRERGGWDGGICRGRDVGRGGGIAQNSISKTFYTLHHNVEWVSSGNDTLGFVLTWDADTPIAIVTLSPNIAWEVLFI